MENCPEGKRWSARVGAPCRMGAGSSRRRRRDGHAIPPHLQIYSLPPPPTTLPYYASYPQPPAGRHRPYYPHPRHQSAPPTSTLRQMSHPSSSGVPDSSFSPQQQSSSTTIRNSVNVQKETIRLAEDTTPGFYLLSFSFSADFPGSISIFYFANVGEGCSVNPVSSYIFKPLGIQFEKGYGQIFKQQTGTGVYLDAIDKEDLQSECADGVCPLVIRAQTFPENSQHMQASEDIGGPLPKSVNVQLTQAVIEWKDNGECKVRVLRQVIWVDGVRYELKELYGIESTVDDGGYDEDDLGKDCIICMSEPRDTAIIPCRHVCMCSGCVSEFKAQMNHCPICRQPVDSLLKIKVNTR